MSLLGTRRWRLGWHRGGEKKYKKYLTRGFPTDSRITKFRLSRSPKPLPRQWTPHKAGPSKRKLKGVGLRDAFSAQLSMPNGEVCGKCCVLKRVWNACAVENVG